MTKSKIQIIIDYQYSKISSLLFFVLIIGFTTPSIGFSADLLYGKSKSNQSCAGTIQMTYPFAELVYDLKAIKNGGTSLNPDFSFIENVWPKVITQATYAAISNDNYNNMLVYKQLLELAKRKTALSTVTREESMKTLCYSKGTDQPCAFQAYKMAVNYFSYYSYSSFLIKPYIDRQAESKIIYDYVREGYQKYIRTNIDPNSEGIFELLDGYIGMYYVAEFLDDAKLAREAINGGLTKIKKQLRRDGTINFSSFRGVRALFYHSFAVDVILSFGELAEREGIRFYQDHDLVDRIRKAIELEIKYAPNPKAFEEKGNFVSQDGIQRYSTDEKQAKRSIHSQALATPILIEKRFPGLLDQKVRDQYFPKKDFGYYADMAVGFVPRCLEFAPEE